MAKILICDDAQFIRKVLGQTLEELGHIVIGEAGDGKDAVVKYQELRPDVVTMDITMPNLDGVGAVQAIMGYDSKARIIMVSAMSQRELVKKAIFSGAKDFIVKPFQKSRVEEALRKVLSS